MTSEMAHSKIFTQNYMIFTKGRLLATIFESAEKARFGFLCNFGDALRCVARNRPLIFTIHDTQ